MDSSLKKIKTEVYDKCDLKMTHFQIEKESKEYDACRFDLNGQKIISRSSKITPTKPGQFVTFWKRNKKGIIEPFNEFDEIDFYVINAKAENEFGQFVFPRSVLIEKGIISTAKKEGKRGFRVYPKWDIASNKQADKTQKWQLDYFYEINGSTCFKNANKLYKAE